jgi:hypothetical protein
MAGIGWAPLGGEWWTWRWCHLVLPAVHCGEHASSTPRAWHIVSCRSVGPSAPGACPVAAPGPPCSVAARQFLGGQMPCYVPSASMASLRALAARQCAAAAAMGAAAPLPPAAASPAALLRRPTTRTRAASFAAASTTAELRKPPITGAVAGRGPAGRISSKAEEDAAAKLLTTVQLLLQRGRPAVAAHLLQQERVQSKQTGGRAVTLDDAESRYEAGGRVLYCRCCPAERLSPTPTMPTAASYTAAAIAAAAADAPCAAARSWCCSWSGR